MPRTRRLPNGNRKTHHGCRSDIGVTIRSFRTLDSEKCSKVIVVLSHGPTSRMYAGMFCTVDNTLDKHGRVPVAGVVFRWGAPSFRSTLFAVFCKDRHLGGGPHSEIPFRPRG